MPPRQWDCSEYKTRQFFTGIDWWLSYFVFCESYFSNICFKETDYFNCYQSYQDMKRLLYLFFLKLIYFNTFLKNLNYLLSKIFFLFQDFILSDFITLSSDLDILFTPNGSIYQIFLLISFLSISYSVSFFFSSSCDNYHEIFFLAFSLIAYMLA